MHHFQWPLTADIETLARTMSMIVEGRLLYSHDRTVLRQDKQLRDNELMADQSNLTWNTYVQYNQCSFHSHYWMRKEKVMEIAIFLGIPYHLLASLVPVHWDPVHRGDKSDMAAANIPVPWELLGEKPELKVLVPFQESMLWLIFTWAGDAALGPVLLSIHEWFATNGSVIETNVVEGSDSCDSVHSSRMEKN